MSTAIEQLIEIAQENLDSLKQSHRGPGTDQCASPAVEARINYEQSVISEVRREIGQNWVERVTGLEDEPELNL